jgi:lipoic acid synthetase
MADTNPALEPGASPGKPEYLRKPEWLRVQLSSGKAYAAVHRTLREGRLNTVCSEARCPNLHECWDRLRTATFMILGDTCTRHCRFCAVKSGRPRLDGLPAGAPAVDPDEPRRVGEAAAALGLRHVVVTMVTRDDLPDGGASAIAATVAAIRKHCPGIGVELLVSDLGGNPEAIRAVVDSRPDILGHNLETVRRLTPEVRSGGTYEGSLDFLRRCRGLAADGGQSAIRIKSSLMLGLGETPEEVLAAMDDLRAAGVGMLNLGQYLQPGPAQLAVRKYWSPEEFAGLKREALARGFVRVESGPLVRSSYHAAESAAGADSPVDA